MTPASRATLRTRTAHRSTRQCWMWTPAAQRLTLTVARSNVGRWPGCRRWTPRSLATPPAATTGVPTRPAVSANKARAPARGVAGSEVCVAPLGGGVVCGAPLISGASKPEGHTPPPSPAPAEKTLTVGGATWPVNAPPPKCWSGLDWWAHGRTLLGQSHTSATPANWPHFWPLQTRSTPPDSIAEPLRLRCHQH
jgi:hypothetical protein